MQSIHDMKTATLHYLLGRGKLFALDEMDGSLILEIKTECTAASVHRMAANLESSGYRVDWEHSTINKVLS